MKMNEIENNQAFILKTIELYFKTQEINDASESTLSEYLNNDHLFTLQVFLNKGKIIFATEVIEPVDTSLIFYKTQDATENSNFSLNVLTISNSPANSLYNILKQVYSPLLSSTKDILTSNINQNLFELESNLKLLTCKDGNNDLQVILSVEDEIDYWRSIAENKNASRKNREYSSSFCQLFQDINEEIRSIETSPLSDGKDLTENICGILDDVWRQNDQYTQKRMTNMFDVIGHKICSIIQKTLTEEDIWQSNRINRTDIIIVISDSLKIIETWNDSCLTLSTTYWPNYAMHPWSGKGYIGSYSSKFAERIKQVLEIISAESQLNKLLTNNEQTEFDVGNVLNSFKSVNLWNVSAANKAWDAAIARFTKKFRPAEIKVAEKLKPRLQNKSAKQILYEFTRYKSLINRPTIKQALTNELDSFITSLCDMLKTMKETLDSNDLPNLGMYRPPEMSTIVQQIQWAKQLETKVLDIKLCAEYLTDFDKTKHLLQLANELLKDLKDMCTQLHEDWSKDLQHQVKSGSLQTSASMPVLQFSSKTNLMEVNFVGRSGALAKELRAMAAMGFKPTHQVQEALTNMNKLLHRARQLQQVASFHNTMGERMIPSTRPMLLQAALALSELVQEQKSVYWDDEQLVGSYADKLNAAVMKLESQNSYLTSQHVAIRNVVESLVDIDLLAKQAEWKKKINEMRDIVEKVESSGYKNSDSWKSHWDWQLYKVLECQYMRTLLSLHKHFPVYRIDLVLRGATVKTQPPLEEIRVQHYHQLRRFINLPATFVGLQNNVAKDTSMFQTIVDNHSWIANKSVSQLEATLSSLDGCCSKWTKRASLACVDLEQLCKDNLHLPEDFELNFKACKAYGQDVAKMSFDDEKIDWLVIGTSNLRRELEIQVRNLWSILISTLQSSCRDDAIALDSFMASANLTLDNRIMPKNAKELAEISAKQMVLKNKMPEMENLVQSLKKKSGMLRTWGGDPSVDNTIKEWQKVKESMLTNQQMFEHQAEIVKSSLKGEWDNLNVSVESWFARWKQGKSNCIQVQDSYEKMKELYQMSYEAKEQWALFVGEKEDLIKEHNKFNMPIEVSDIWLNAQKMMSENVALWLPFKEYEEQFEALSGQEWMVFQKKLHLIDEFVVKWTSNLEPFTPVTLFLQQELDKYKDLTPLLKHMRGTDFTEKHWRNVFNLLDMEYKKPDTLLLKDILKVTGNIKKHIKALQKISASASSETAIRSALNDLELWYAGVRLSLTYYSDKSNQSVAIVKGFKEIIAKIEEQQWIVSSVRGGETSDACVPWETRLKSAHAMIKSINHTQRRWLFLEPILSNDEGELGLKFRKVDQLFRQISRTVENDPRLSALVQSAKLQSTLDNTSEKLAACQVELNQYIEDKRSIFPRLYFLSDDDLLELLGQARAGASGREAVMQNHLKKLFPGIIGVKLGQDGLSITGLLSHHEEMFQLAKPVDIDCPVEQWLKKLEDEMQSSLKSLTIKCLKSQTMQDPFTLPTQTICLAQNIRFTEQVEKAISNKELHKYKEIVIKENKNYAEMVVDGPSERLKRQALILQCVHFENVLDQLIDNNVTSTGSWLWQKQLRFYLIGKNEIVAKMALAEIPYSYEYLGVNTGQFVRTDLADECFLLLTQAQHLKQVGNPFGPAGTGKTESVKALGGLMGRLVLVFNCDEAMDSRSLSRLVRGLVLVGAWGCFDEFNRLSAEACAQAAILFDDVAHQRIAGTDAKIVSLSCVFCTLNPSSLLYKGRRPLPPSLLPLLRPSSSPPPPSSLLLASPLLSAKAIPHYQHIAIIMNNVFYMARELITGERHYDWGLRALKSAVNSCGEALSQTDAPTELPEQKALLCRVLRLNNLSKLTASDAIRFEAILSMLFVDVKPDDSVVNPLISILESTADSLGLVRNKMQIQKCIELYEQLQQRMGVAVVGPPGSGKSTIIKLLKAALSSMGRTVNSVSICAKALSRSALLGEFASEQRRWADGVLAHTAQQAATQPTDIWSWIICDGDIDPEWIESLNSVLDDNRLLTLPSGWRIQFPPNVNYFFETHSLEHASPATISRLGIILISNEYMSSIDLFDHWISKLEIENEVGKMAVPLLQRVVKKFLIWLKKHRSDVIKVDEVSILKHILAQFEDVISNISPTSSNTPEDFVNTTIQRSVSNILKNISISSFNDEMSTVLGILPSISHTGEWVDDIIYMSPRMLAAEPAVRAIVNSKESHLLVVGPTGNGKNLLTEYVLKSCESPVIAIDCTPALKPEDIIEELKRNNAVRSGGGMSNSGMSISLFVRGLHRCRRDQWGSSAVLALLMQIIQYKGFWEQSKDSSIGVNWCCLQRLRLVATTADGNLHPRFMANVCIVTLPEPDDEELMEITSYCLRKCVDKTITDIGVVAKNMLHVFKEVSETFYSQPHYKWNTSHLKQWCDNIRLYSFSGKSEFLLAIVSEAYNIFGNRLINDSNKIEFSRIIHEVFKDNSKMHYLPKLTGSWVILEAIEYKQWCLFGEKIINQCFSEHEHSIFGDSGAEVSVELSLLCSTIARTLNGGMCVCVSSSGVGRLASVHILSTMLATHVLCVNDCNEFNGQLKNALSNVGIEDNKTLIFVSESAITHTTLRQIEALTKSRSIHAIPKEVMPSLAQTQSATQFLDNVKRNLGIVMCLDKSDPNILEYFEQYPMLYKDSHLVWLDGWSDDTLREIPRLAIQRLMKEDISENVDEDLSLIPVDGFVSIYKSLEGDWLRAPCRYMNFVKSYYSIIKRKKASLVQRRNILSAGVDALNRARSEVAVLQSSAAEQEAAFLEKQTKANSALDQISSTVRAATDRKEEMHHLKSNIEVENQKLQMRKSEIEKELASVEPVIAAARAAVGDIKTEALSEIRSLRAPPDVVRDVLEGVLRLMGIADTSWHSMKNFLSKRGVKEDIRNLEASSISVESVQCVERLLESRSNSFSEASAKRASAAVAPLAKWVKANCHYARVAHRVQPLRTQQMLLDRNLQEAQEQLSSLSSGLQTVEERVATLKEQLGQHTRDAAAIELKLNNAKATIDAASGLLDQLAEEYLVWEADLKEISKEISEMTPRCLLSAAYIAFLPDVTEPQAREYLSKWSKLVNFDEQEFSVINFLSSTEKQLKWDSDGLPLDKSAIKNAVFIDQYLQDCRCGFTPLIIDPDGEAISWLKNSLKDHPCDFVSYDSEKINTTVQYAMRLNRLLVITEVQSISWPWSPLLRGLPISGASGRVFLYTKDSSLVNRLTPHHRATLSIVHFTARIDGLTDQLVHCALEDQNPEVNERSKELKLNKTTLQKQQYELQENLLKDLSTNNDILNDANLLSSLNKTRKTATSISESLNTAKALEKQINTTCDAYNSSATVVAKLALAVKELSSVYPLVVLPIEVVLEVYVQGVKKGGNDMNNLDNDAIIKFVTKRIIERTLLGLHKKEKYIVVLHLLKQVYEDVVTDELWQIFIGSNTYEDEKIEREIKTKYEWLPDHAIKRLSYLQYSAPDLLKKLQLESTGLWQTFLQSGDLNVINKLDLGEFERVVAVQAIRPQTLYRAIASYVERMLGVGVMSSGKELISCVRCSETRNSIRPILLLTAHGVQQLAAFALANKRNLAQVLTESGKAAWLKIIEDNKSGGWVAILVGGSPFNNEIKSFITELADMPLKNFCPDFRLWIVSEDREVPSLIANACVNVVLESPEGVKSNVLSSLSSWGEFLNEDVRLVRTLVSLTIMHAIVQERRDYVPQGWSKWYNFSWSEIQSCWKVVQSNGPTDVSRRVCTVLYLGLITSATDRKLFSAIAERCLGEHSMSNSWSPVGSGIDLPYGKRLQDYTSALMSLPDIDTPEILGLSSDCRLARDNKYAQNIIAGLRDLNISMSLKRKSDNVQSSLKPLLGLWKKLMSGNPLLKGDISVDSCNTGWWSGVCCSESAEASVCVRTVHSTLATLKRGNASTTLTKVPEEWQVLWLGPDEPEQYLRELTYRANAAVYRMQHLQPDLPEEIDLRCLMQPKRMIAVLQALTVEHIKCPPDELLLHVNWDTNKVSNTKAGPCLKIVNLDLSGAIWSKGLLPAGGITRAPVLTIYFVQDKISSIVDKHFDVPVYNNEKREDVLFYAPAILGSGFDSTLAILNAVALIVPHV